jgi:tetratricopeptide (TPR) repeat protein
MDIKKRAELIDLIINSGKDFALEFAKSLIDYYKVDLKGTDFIDEFLQIGMDYDRYGEHEKALMIYQRAARRAITIGDNYGLGSIYSNMGVSYNYLKDYDKALEYYQKAFELIQKYDREDEIAVLYNNIGFVYKNILKYQEAGESYYKALNIFSKLGDKFNMTACYFNLSELFLILYDYETSLEFIEKCIDIDEELNLPSLKKDLEFKEKIILKHNEYNRKNKLPTKHNTTVITKPSDFDDEEEQPTKKRSWFWNRK